MAAFTTIAALGMSAAGSAFSFIQAGKQAQAERDANKAAAKAVAKASAKSTSEVHFSPGSLCQFNMNNPMT